VTYLAVCLESVPLVCVVLPQKSIFCCAGFGSVIALGQGLQTTVREDFVNNEKIIYLRRIS